MQNFYHDGCNLRASAKNLVYTFMQATPDCYSYADGMRAAEIFRACGLDWGTYENATSSNQQYWLVALLRELESENKIVRDTSTKLWRLK